MKNMRSILAIAMALILTMALFTGCGAASTPGTQLADGGVLCLRVNPEIAIHYDADGNVTKLESRNADANAIVEAYADYEGKPAREVVAELVTAIGEAGYFVEEIEGERRQITIEIEAGSALPSATFLTDVADEVRIAVNAHDWASPVRLDGITDYDDTDYGPNNDGVTDYDHNLNDDTDYGPNNDGITDFGKTDYNDNTDYGVNADGNTDYNDSDYGVWGDGVTDYDHNINDGTDYGEGNDGVTDYDGTDYNANTDYGVNADGNTDYNDTDYGVWGDGVTDYIPAPTTGSTGNTGSAGSTGHTDYDDTDYGPNNDGVTDYNDTNYGDTSYGTNYGSNYG